MEENILRLLVSFLGDYGKESGGWYSFNCPNCAEIKGVKADNKYNLEITIDPAENGCGYCHCWSCEKRYTLVKLFKKYAPRETFDELRHIVIDYRESRKYQLNLKTTEFANEFSENGEFMLPKGYKPIREDDKEAKDAIEYLTGRGIGAKIIERFNIGYIGDDKSSNFVLRNRIIIPSYDWNDNLNYWVGRDYTGKAKLRYKNPKAEKSMFVFNESKVNWYEPITLVEGPFDHIVVPNSIPLLGKVLKPDYAVYQTLVSKAKSLVRIFLDDDAPEAARRMYKLLNDSTLKGKVQLIQCPEGFDASLLYEKQGAKAIISLLNKGITLTDYELLNYRSTTPT